MTADSDVNYADPSIDSACPGFDKQGQPRNIGDTPALDDALPQSDPSTATASDGSDSDGSETTSDAGGHRFTMAETVMIFDWDDTVLPSSWVQEQGLRLDDESYLSEWQEAELTEMATIASETLRVAKRLGTVVLVTNAERGWIELSCQKFMPSLAASLEGVNLLSARTTYERPDVASPFEWKLRAFESELDRIFGDVMGSEASSETYGRKNIISLGDSAHEREALIHATSQIPNCRTKSLKFVERPDIEQLRKQHALIVGCFRRIVHHDGNLDLCIRCS